ncbi:MAG: hypothetical protein R2713_17450 [Ilumatobacteraceae bacterium]
MPTRLDGSGLMVVTLVEEITKLADQAAAPLAPVHEREVADPRPGWQRRASGSGRKSLEDRHKREVRRYRTDELRSGLAVMAATYRDAFVAGRASRPDAATHAVRRIHDALEALERNPNEPLLLQHLLLELPSL